MNQTWSRPDVEDFLYMEARYLDSRKFDEWLNLFTDDCIYWMPCGENDYDPTRRVSLIYDDRKQLGERVWRLQSGFAYGQEPSSKTNHLITNVEILSQSSDSAKITSNFLISELRVGVQSFYTGRMEHHLKKVGGEVKIAYKKVELINNGEPLGNLSFLF